MKKLPIGISNLKEIIEQKYVYVDKTEIAFNLINSGKYYFLSRPRRFGKSLFLDTLKEIFQGNKELFKDLYIYDKYDF
ncbi:MAG: AAA family ATPase, partial [Novosphingobium sp.]|nr:AAA family ATPase [Novosphingobium sp.]